MIVLRDAWDYLTAGSSWSGDDGMLHLGLQQLLITVTALAIAMAIGLPIALWLGHLGRLGFLAINVSNVGRAVPTFALLGLFVTLDSWKDGIPLPFTDSAIPLHLSRFPGVLSFGPYGRAGVSVLIALALFALPPLITNAYVAMREVDDDVVEAATGVGMSGWQRFRKVEVPLALPLIMSGVRLALVQVWATATIAALVAGPGLGTVITGGFYRNKYGQGIAAAIVVALVALVLELVAALLQRLADPVPRTRTSRRGGRDGARGGGGAMSEDAPMVAAATSQAGPPTRS